MLRERWVCEIKGDSGGVLEVIILLFRSAFILSESGQFFHLSL